MVFASARHGALASRWLLAFAGGLLVGTACGEHLFGPPLVLARCDPSSTARDNCDDGYVCCSDDAATLGGGEPLFSAARNDRGRFGMCVYTDAIAGQGLDEPPDCPLPCNPQWEASRVEAVCGADRSCCQTVELHEDDCVFDDALGLWRPADGRDALASLDGAPDRWTPTPRSTHQDPDFAVCEAVAGGDRGSAVFLECVGQLTTAAGRGYCMAVAPDECPSASPDYIDACEAKN